MGIQTAHPMTREGASKMVKITGLDGVSKSLNEASKALEGLQENLGSVSFDPHDPASIDRAMREVDAMVDDKLGDYSSNAIIGPLAEQMKEQYRAAIRERAAAARLEADDTDD